MSDISDAAKLGELLQMGDNYNGYGSAAPNNLSVANACLLIAGMAAVGCPTRYLGASADGGVYAVFDITKLSKDFDFCIEAENDGEATAVITSDSTVGITVFEVDLDARPLPAYLESLLQAKLADRAKRLK